MHIRQYYPAFFDGFEVWEGDVQTLEEFLAIPFIDRLFKEVPDLERVIAKKYCDASVLGEFTDGKRFVVAFATGEDREEVRLTARNGNTNTLRRRSWGLWGNGPWYEGLGACRLRYR